MTSTPIPIDLMIEPRWIATVDTDAVLKNHAIAIKNGRIVDVLPSTEAHSRYQPAITHSLQEHLLIPGLINLHTHAAMTLMRGLADDQPLMTWLQQHIWPTEAKHVSPQFVLDGSRLACVEMLLSGITCFNDMYFFPDATAQAVTEFGLRAAIGITTLEFPTNYASDADDYIAKGLAVRERWQDNPQLSFCLAPHAPYTVSDKTFKRLATLAERLGLGIHCHINETRQEIEDSLKTHGMRPLRRLHNLGILGPQTTGAHAVHLDREDLELLSSTNVSVAHCPTSNLKLASGFADVVRMQQAGINVGLGTDSAASNNRLDIIGEMRLASLLAKGLTGDASALPAQHVLRMATLDSARALGLDHEIGSLTPGKYADICAIDLGGLIHGPCFDPLSHLINVASRDCISHVWVSGRCCVQDKKILSGNGIRLEAPVALWQNLLEVHQAGRNSHD